MTIFRFASKQFPLFAVASSSFNLSSVPLVEFCERCVNDKWWNSPQNAARYILFKGKITARNQKKIAWENEEPRRSQNTRAKTGCHGRACHHGQPVVLNGLGALDFSIPYILCVALHRVLPWIIHLRPIGPFFANFLELIWSSLHTFLLTIDSLGVNLQSKTQIGRNQV